MKVKELIEKLQQIDPELDVIIEPHIDCMDACETPYFAGDVLFDKIAPITFRYSEAQSSRETEEDSFDEDWIEYCYDTFKDPVDSKIVLVLSSPDFKYGTTEKEEKESGIVK